MPLPGARKRFAKRSPGGWRWVPKVELGVSIGLPTR
jgi:hypothetical protein